MKDVIRTGGESVSPSEVEAALAGCGGVRELAVVGLPDPEWGELVCAVVVPEPGASLTLDALRAHCEGRIAGFKRPRRLVELPALPRTPATGQVQRALLIERITTGKLKEGAMTSEERRLGDVATKLLFENERVRVWEMRLGPGEEGDVHRHDLDYVLVQIEGDRMAVVPEPDSGGSFREVPRGRRSGRATRSSSSAAGSRRRGTSGKRAYREILIELKDWRARSAPAGSRKARAPSAWRRRAACPRAA